MKQPKALKSKWMWCTSKLSTIHELHRCSFKIVQMSYMYMYVYFILFLWFWQTIETYVSCYICILNPWNISRILTQHTHSPSLFCLVVICGVFFCSIFYLKVFWSTLWQGIFDKSVQCWSIEALVSWRTIIHASFFLLIFCCFSNLSYNLH